MNLKTLEHHLETLRRIDLGKLRTEALHWAKVCQNNSPRPDGYPTSHIGAEPSTAPTPSRADDEAPLNPIESAAIARKTLDQIDMKTAVMLGNIATAARALELAMSKATECRNLQAQVKTEPKPECWVMRQRADVFEEAKSKTDLGGLLDEPRHVSRWVQDYVTRIGVLPTREQCRQHARGDRVMISA